jgi:hypothetical protein
MSFVVVVIDIGLERVNVDYERKTRPNFSHNSAQLYYSSHIRVIIRGMADVTSARNLGATDAKTQDGGLYRLQRYAATVVQPSKR